MTEKQYGGATGRGTDKVAKASNKNMAKIVKKTETPVKKQEDTPKSEKESHNDFIKAGKIASEVVKYAKTIVKKDASLLEIANKIEEKIVSLGAKPAFPTNLSINEVAAHDTPSFNDTRIASGLLKVDIGVQINGAIADVAFSIDMEGSDENKKLIQASEKALNKALDSIKPKIRLREIGKLIDSTIKAEGFQSIRNLSGHSLDAYDLHSGVTIPNYDNSQEIELEEGAYAVEPFATTGFGSVKDGKPSGIYRIEREGMVRDNFAREVLGFIIEEYQTLPFCSRWIQKKFGTRGLLALRRIEEAGLLHQYPQLVETSGKKVSQAEHTILIEKNSKLITTC